MKAEEKKRLLSRDVDDKVKIERIILVGNLLQRYLRNESVSNTEKKVLDAYDISSMDSLWNVPKEQELHPDALREMELNVYNKVSQHIGLPKTDWEEVEASLKHRSPAKSHRHRKASFLVTIAASIAILLGIWLFLNPLNMQEAYFAELQTQEITLDDQTVVTLNKGSKLTVSRRFNRKKRTVELSGEAFFDVTPNPQKPFIVKHGELITQVKGTAFTVTNYEQLDINSVTVTTGKVQVSKDEQLLAQLTPHMQLVYDKTTNRHQINEASDFSGNWTQGGVVFNNASKQEIIFRLKQHFGVTVSDTNRSLPANIQFNASFGKDASLENVLERIALVYGINYVIKGNSVVIQ